VARKEGGGKHRTLRAFRAIAEVAVLATARRPPFDIDSPYPNGIGIYPPSIVARNVYTACERWFWARLQPIGVSGGFADAGDLADNYLFHVKRARLIDLEDYGQAMGLPIVLPEAVWPRALLYLCDWGEAVISCVDCQTGNVYGCAPGEQNLTYQFEQWLQGVLKYQ
jgi:hypothetical protein